MANSIWTISKSKIEPQFYSLQVHRKKNVALQSFKSIYGAKYKTLQVCDFLYLVTVTVCGKQICILQMLMTRFHQ